MLFQLHLIILSVAVAEGLGKANPLNYLELQIDYIFCTSISDLNNKSKIVSNVLKVPKKVKIV